MSIFTENNNNNNNNKCTKERREGVLPFNLIRIRREEKDDFRSIKASISLIAHTLCNFAKVVINVIRSKKKKATTHIILSLFFNRRQCARFFLFAFYIHSLKYKGYDAAAQVQIYINNEVQKSLSRAGGMCMLARYLRASALTHLDYYA